MDKEDKKNIMNFVDNLDKKVSDQSGILYIICISLFFFVLFIGFIVGFISTIFESLDKALETKIKYMNDSQWENSLRIFKESCNDRMD